MARNKYYRLETGLHAAQLFQVDLSEEYKKKFLDKRGSLSANHMGTPYTPEFYHTPNMLADGWVCQTEEDGRFETPDDSAESKELAKLLCKAFICFAAIDSWLSQEDKNKATVAYWTKIIDRSSPKDLLEELTKELYEAQPDKKRTSRLEERKLAAAESKVK